MRGLWNNSGIFRSPGDTTFVYFWGTPHLSYVGKAKHVRDKVEHSSGPVERVPGTHHLDALPQTS